MDKISKIIREEINKVVNEGIGIVNNNHVLREENVLRNDDLMEYAKLGKQYTGLNVDIFVDDGEAYKRNEHPLWIYVRNGYSNTDSFFPVVVSKTPFVPSHISKDDINIQEADLEAVMVFVSINALLLRDFANEKVEHMDFYKICKPVIYDIKKTSGGMSLDEMATLRPKVSGLPTVIWIDEGTSPKHGPRIKFQAAKYQMKTMEYSSMSISQNPVIFNPPKKYDLSKRDLRRIIDFVRANEANLLKVANGEMTYEQFLTVMIRT